MKRIALGLLLTAVSGPAWGQSCASLPYNLANGTVANADQVMANLNCLVLKGTTTFTGNVGIGTTTPDNPLSISTSTYHTGLHLTGSTNNTMGDFRISVNNMQGAWNSITSPSDIVMTWEVGNGLVIAPHSNAISGLRIAYNGSVGIGINSSAQKLYVNGSAAGTSAWQVASDGRLKTNVAPLKGGLALIEQLNPVRFDWRTPANRTVGKDLSLPVGERQIGFIAQEVEKVVPEAVTAPANGTEETYSLRQDNLIPVLVAAIKEQQAQIKALRDDIAGLKVRR